jgi:hypothetical protein
MRITLTGLPRTGTTDLTGRVFGRLTVISFSHSERKSGPTKRGYHYFWNCMCSCGKHKVAMGQSLLGGNTQSCGCYAIERAIETQTSADRSYCTVHGMHASPEHGNWTAMLQRCRNPNAHGYELYGGRGITVCDRWLEFSAFFADMGERPTPKHSLDRFPDRNGPYEPGNVRWATQEEQANNTSSNVWLEYDGKRLTIAQWSRATGLQHGTIRARLRAQWPIEQVLSVGVAR